MNYNEKYQLAVKLIQKGYLIHCTDEVFDNFDSKYIKGGMRAKEGYGFYFSDMPYKSIDYGEIMKLIRKSDFNFIDSSKEIDTSLFYNEDIDVQIAQYEERLDYCRNVRDYDYISNVIDKLKNEKEKYDSDLTYYVKQAIRDGAKTYGNLEYLIRNPQTTIPKLIKSYINNGIDGYYTDGIYTVFNVSKLNELMVKNPQEIINQLISSNESLSKDNNLIVENLFKEIINEMVSPVIWHFCWLDNLLGILETNSINLGKSEVDRDKLPGVTGYSQKRPYYLCTTRSKLSSDGYSDLVTNDNQEGFVRIQLDGNKLNSIVHAKASDYFGDRNEPVHGKRAFYNAVEKGQEKYYHVLNKENEREDTIWYHKDKISNINKYIQRIDVCIPNKQSFNVNQEMILNIVNLANGLNIPLFIYNNIRDFDKQNNNIVKLYENKGKSNQLLNEMISPVVWHFTTIKNANAILDSNVFKLTPYNDVEDDFTGFSPSHPYFMSLTRSKSTKEGFQKYFSGRYSPYVRFTIDGQRLNTIAHGKADSFFKGKNKNYLYNQIENGAYKDTPIKNSYSKWKTDYNEKEDRIWYNKNVIKNANQYIRRVDVFVPGGYLTKPMFLSYYQNILERSQQLNIPCYFYGREKDFDVQNNNILDTSRIQKRNEQMNNISMIYTLNEATEGKIKPTPEWMKQQYDIMNKKLFNGQLGDCILRPFTTGKGSNGNTLGWFKITGDNIKVNRNTRRIFQKGYYSNINIDSGNFVHLCKPCIELNANYSAPPESWINTLVHEMCHYYTYMNGYAPVQAHGHEFKSIGSIVSQRSGGVITIQRLATAEEMSTMELDADIQAKNDARAQRKDNNTIVAIIVMKDRTIRMVRTTLPKVLDEIKRVHEERNDFYYCGYTSNLQLAQYLTKNGYTSSCRTYRYWNIEQQHWLAELLRYTWKPLIFNHETFRDSLDKIFGGNTFTQKEKIQEPATKNNDNIVNQQQANNTNISQEEYHHGFKIVQKNGKYNLVDEKGNPRFRESVDKIWFDKNENLFYFQHGKWTHKGVPGKWQRV